MVVVVVAAAAAAAAVVISTVKITTGSKDNQQDRSLKPASLLDPVGGGCADSSGTDYRPLRWVGQFVQALHAERGSNCSKGYGSPSTGSLHPLGHPITFPVLRDTAEDAECSS